jgi:hypothetical protein
MFLAMMFIGAACTLYGSRRCVIESRQLQRTHLAIFFAVMLSLIFAATQRNPRSALEASFVDFAR